MADHEKLKKELKKLISTNQTDKAFDILEKENLSYLEKDILLLKNRYERLKEGKRRNVITKDAAEVEQNQFNEDFLDLVDLIKSNKVGTQTPSQIATKNNSKLYLSIVGGLLVLALSVWGISSMGADGKNDTKQTTSAATDVKVKTRAQIVQDSIKEVNLKIKAQKEKAAAERRKKIILGKNFEGGIIFYIDSVARKGLIMAKVDQTKNGPIAWGENELDKYEAVDKGLFDGAANTDKIAKNFKRGTNNPARLCRDYVYIGTAGEFSDWYLPSRDELDLLWEFTADKKSNSSIVRHEGFTDHYYWSSTEVSGKDVYYRSFFNKGKFEWIKGNKAKVRAIRQFEW